MVSALHFLLVLLVAVPLVNSNSIDCSAEPDKCKHADSCEDCGVHLDQSWAYCDAASYIATTGDGSNDGAAAAAPGEAVGSGAVDTSSMKNCRLLDSTSVGEVFKKSMCDFCSGDCLYRSCKTSTKHVRIIIGATGGTILLLLIIWIWCCCRKRGKKTLNTKKSKQDAMEMKQTNKREERQDSRRADRDDRLSWMRAKYGLQSNGDGYKDDLMSADDGYKDD